MVSIVLIEDHTLVREGLKALLRERPDFKVVDEASEGKHGIKLVERHKPDLVLLDMVLPGLHGLEVLRKVRRFSKVLALSMRSDEAFIAEAFANGVAGYIVKEDSFNELIDGPPCRAQGPALHEPQTGPAPHQSPHRSNQYGRSLGP